MVVIERVSAARTIFTFTVSSIYSILVGITVLFRILIIGPKKYFALGKRDKRPPELDDELYGTHGFARLQTIRLHYVSKGSEDKPLMLFVHGFPEFWYSWRHQLAEFGGEYRAVAFDMRGYGESEKPHGIKNYTLDKLVNDVKELIHFLGHEKCILLGHDWGGAVAWAFAQMHPEMTESVIVCNCPNVQTILKNVDSSFAQFMKSWYIFFFQMPWLPEASVLSEDFKAIEKTFRKIEGMSEDDIEAYKFSFAKPDGLTGPINYYRAIMKYKIPLQFPSEKIQVPSMMIWGPNDRALGKELAELNRSYVENYKICYIDGAGHWVQQEKPDEVNKVVREFLAEQTCMDRQTYI